MAFNNRIIVGLIILIFFSISFFLKLDYIFLFLITTLSIFEISKINSNFLNILYKKILFFIFCFLILLIIYFYNINFLYLLFFFLVFITLFIKNNIEIVFGASLFIILILFFEILQLDRNLFYTIFFISFLNDTFAFFIGSYFKGPLILPSISPKKTWSGTLSSFFIIFILLLSLNYEIFFSLLLSSSLFLGDIFFSFIKRKKNIKDFSNILGSHGGILDRIDSMFFFIPLNYFNFLYV